MKALQKNLLISKTSNFDENLNDFIPKLEEELEVILPASSSRLHQAMRYSVLNGGKRIRPYLTWACAHLFSVPERNALQVGAAIELIHAYSLVHDDLPCMDDAETRRGKPSCHKAFGEATAVLVGDALIPLAFQTVGLVQVDPIMKFKLIEGLARVSGSQGIVAGQMMDLGQETFTLNLDNLMTLQRLKTAAIFEFSVEAGALLGSAGIDQQQALKSYGLLFGQAFQMIDDLLDHCGTNETLGKPSQQDEEKFTYLSFLTPSELYDRIRITLDEALAYLSYFNERTDLLEGIVAYALDQLHKGGKIPPLQKLT